MDVRRRTFLSATIALGLSGWLRLSGMGALEGYDRMKKGPAREAEARFPSDNTAIVLVDMQEDLVGTNGMLPERLRQDLSFQAELETEITHQAAVLDFGRRHCLKILVFEYEGCGDTIESLRQVIETYPRREYIIKKHKDCFKETALHKRLEEENIANLLLMGVEERDCVLVTAKRAYELGYSLLISDELIAGPTYYEYSMLKYAPYDATISGAVIGTGEEIMGMNADEFPELSKEYWVRKRLPKDMGWYQENTVFRHDYRDLMKLVSSKMTGKCNKV